MSSEEMVHLRLKPIGTRESINAIISDLQVHGYHATTLTSAINKVVCEWVMKGDIPHKYRTK